METMGSPRSALLLILILMLRLQDRSHALPSTSSQGARACQWCKVSGAPKVQCPNQMELLVQIQGKECVLKLTKTTDFLAMNFTASHYRGDGERVTDRPGPLAHCCYTGTVQGVAGSAASACTTPEISGYISMEDDMYSINPLYASEPSTLKATYLGRKSPPRRHPRSLYFVDPQGRPETYSIELFLVADKKEFQRHGEDPERTRQHLISVAHHLNQIFSRIGIQVFLVGVEIWTHENKAVISESAHTTLQRFLHWREENLLPRHHHDNVQLISGSQFKNHALGEAYLGKMCTRSQSGGIIKDTGLSARELAMYVAHEMGHNLGMKHDTDDCYCPATRGKCLLSRHTGHNMNDMFSDCSHRFFHRFLEEKDASCLKDQPHTFINEPMLLQSQSYEFESLLEAVGLISTVLCLVVLLLVMVIFCGTKVFRRKKVVTIQTTYPS